SPVLLPNLGSGEPHPLPYYVSKEVVLPPPTDLPWKPDETKKAKALAENFNRDGRLQKAFMEEFLKDNIQDDIVAVASVIVEESKYKEETDREVAVLVEEDFIMPEVQEQVYIAMWSLLYDMGRSLEADQLRSLRAKEDQLALEPQQMDALFDHVMEGEDWADDLSEEKVLSHLPWESLIFHYHQLLTTKALSNNHSLHLLQERLVSAVGGEEVFQEVLLDAVEEELRTLDEMEKMTTPPRQG
ncbi:unnamed protein product, partial [Meganyctiphanes norvegica]